jgi:hypothetical protein
LDTKMNELLAKVSISKIKLMINNISEWSQWIDDHNYYKIAEEISIAEKKWINVDEIKDMIYW